MTSSLADRSGRLKIELALINLFEMFGRAALKFRVLMPTALTDSYRPELHYMRGPGPKCRGRISQSAPGHVSPKSNLRAKSNAS